MLMNLLLNTDFNEADIKVLKQHISNFLICLSLHQKLDDQLIESLYEKGSTDLKSDLNRIYKVIRLNKIVGTHYQNAFVAAPINFQDPAVINATHIMQARLWASAYTLIQLNGYQEVIHRAFDEYRLLVSKPDTYQLTLLPRFHLADDILITELECAKEKANKSTAARIQNYITLIKSYVDRVPENTKRKRSIETVEVRKAKKVQLTTKLENDYDEPKVERFIVTENTQDESTSNNEEYIFDTVVTSQYISVKAASETEANYSLNLKVQQAKSAANAIQRRDRKLITEVGSLTDFEISKIILYADYYSQNYNSIFGLLLLSLFSGRSVDVIIGHIESKKLVHDGFQYKLIEQIHLPPHKLERIEVDGQVINKEQLEEFVLRAKKDIKLSYPSLTPKVSIDSSLDEIEAKLTQLITKVNKKWHTRITLAKIQNHFSFFLQNNAVDVAEQTLLLGHDIRQSSANYYYQLPRKRLAVIHEYFKKSLLETSLSSDRGEPFTDERVGSQLQLKQEKLGLLLYDMSSRLENSSAYNYDVFHNLYTLYVMLILNLSTGYRDVRDPFDDIKYFDLINNTVLINDKNVRGRLATRVCKLPPLAVKQVEEYLIHLERLSCYLMPTDNTLGFHFQKMINGEQPLFTFIKDRKILRTLQKNIKEELKPILPIPVNWYRHFLRTFLRGNSVPPEAVDCFMGHSPMGDISFEKFSGLSLAQLSIVAEVIESKLFGALNINAVKGWGAKS